MSSAYERVPTDDVELESISSNRDVEFGLSRDPTTFAVNAVLAGTVQVLGFHVRLLMCSRVLRTPEQREHTFGKEKVQMFAIMHRSSNILRSRR